MIRVASFVRMTTRSGAGVSMSATSTRRGPAYPVVERLPMARRMLNLTSSDVTSSPVWNLTPLRSVNVQRLWSADDSQWLASPPSFESCPSGVTPIR